MGWRGEAVIIILINISKEDGVMGRVGAGGWGDYWGLFIDFFFDPSDLHCITPSSAEGEEMKRSRSSNAVPPPRNPSPHHGT